MAVGLWHGRDEHPGFPVYTYAQPGIYTVTQWSTDTASGEADSLTRTGYITVTGESPPSVVTMTLTYG